MLVKGDEKVVCYWLQTIDLPGNRYLSINLLRSGPASDHEGGTPSVLPASPAIPVGLPKSLQISLLERRPNDVAIRSAEGSDTPGFSFDKTIICPNRLPAALAKL